MSFVICFPRTFLQRLPKCHFPFYLLEHRATSRGSEKMSVTCRQQPQTDQKSWVWLNMTRWRIFSSFFLILDVSWRSRMQSMTETLFRSASWRVCSQELLWLVKKIVWVTEVWWEVTLLYVICRTINTEVKNSPHCLIWPYWKKVSAFHLQIGLLFQLHLYIYMCT